jgi:hypothetical protein
MFLIGIWAGQTIIYPPDSENASPSSNRELAEVPVEDIAGAATVEILLLPRERKKRVAPLVGESCLIGGP